MYLCLSHPQKHYTLQSTLQSPAPIDHTHGLKTEMKLLQALSLVLILRRVHASLPYGLPDLGQWGLMYYWMTDD